MASQGKHDQIISDNVLHFKVAKSNIEALWQFLIEDSTVHSCFGSQQIKWLFIMELCLRVLQKTGWCNRNYPKKKYWKATTDMHSAANYTGQNRSNIKFKTIDLSQRCYKLSSHDYISAPSINQCEAWTTTNWRKIWSRLQKPTTWFHTAIIKNMERGKLTLSQLWTLWKKHYLLSVGERSQIMNKCSRIQSSKEPKLRDIVQIKELTPGNTWRLGKIIGTSSKSQASKQTHFAILTHTSISFGMKQIEIKRWIQQL